MSITVTWHGHATFSLNIDGHRLIVDPFLNDNPSATKKAEDVEADFVLLTHGHQDHVADALSIAQRCNAQIISNFEIVDWYIANGHEKGHHLSLGGGNTFPFGHVKMTIAFHSSSMPDGAYGGMPGGFLITAGGKRIYIAGDTAVFSDMALIGRNDLDLAILPIGDNFTMGPDDSLLAIDFLKPKQVIPCHYNTWPLIAVDEKAWARRVVDETEAVPVVLGVEESVTI